MSSVFPTHNTLISGTQTITFSIDVSVPTRTFFVSGLQFDTPTPALVDSADQTAVAAPATTTFFLTGDALSTPSLVVMSVPQVYLSASITPSNISPTIVVIGISSAPRPLGSHSPEASNSTPPLESRIWGPIFGVLFFVIIGSLILAFVIYKGRSGLKHPPPPPPDDIGAVFIHAEKHSSEDTVLEQQLEVTASRPGWSGVSDSEEIAPQSPIERNVEVDVKLRRGTPAGVTAQHFQYDMDAPRHSGQDTEADTEDDVSVHLTDVDEYSQYDTDASRYSKEDVEAEAEVDVSIHPTDVEEHSQHSPRASSPGGSVSTPTESRISYISASSKGEVPRRPASDGRPITSPSGNWSQRPHSLGTTPGFRFPAPHLPPHMDAAGPSKVRRSLPASPAPSDSTFPTVYSQPSPPSSPPITPRPDPETRSARPLCAFPRTSIRLSKREARRSRKSMPPVPHGSSMSQPPVLHRPSKSQPQLISPSSPPVSPKLGPTTPSSRSLCNFPRTSIRLSKREARRSRQSIPPVPHKSLSAPQPIPPVPHRPPSIPQPSPPPSPPISPKLSPAQPSARSLCDFPRASIRLSLREARRSHQIMPPPRRGSLSRRNTNSSISRNNSQPALPPAGSFEDMISNQGADGSGSTVSVSRRTSIEKVREAFASHLEEANQAHEEFVDPRIRVYEDGGLRLLSARPSMAKSFTENDIPPAYKEHYENN